MPDVEAWKHPVGYYAAPEAVPHDRHRNFSGHPMHPVALDHAYTAEVTIAFRCECCPPHVVCMAPTTSQATVSVSEFKLPSFRVRAVDHDDAYARLFAVFAAARAGAIAWRKDEIVADFAAYLGQLEAEGDACCVCPSEQERDRESYEIAKQQVLTPNESRF